MILTLGLALGALVLPPTILLNGHAPDLAAASCSGPTRHLGVTCDGGVALVSVHTTVAGSLGAARNLLRTVAIVLAIMGGGLLVGRRGIFREQGRDVPECPDWIVPARRGPPLAAFCAI